MDIWLFWHPSLPTPTASCSDGLTAGLQSGASVLQLRAGRVRHLALQLLAWLRSPRRWGEATEDGSRLLPHPLSKKMHPKKARTLGWTQTDYLFGVSKGSLQRVVKKRKLEAALLCENAAETKPSIPSFPLCSCDIFHHLNTQFAFFCVFFLWRVFILCRWGRLPQIRGGCAVFKQVAIYTELPPGRPIILIQFQFKSFILKVCLIFLPETTVNFNRRLFRQG